jgi:hypothetical protein
MIFETGWLYVMLALLENGGEDQQSKSVDKGGVGLGTQ